LVFHFSDFSTIFYAIYRKQPKHFYYLSYPFAGRPSKRTSVLQCGPWGGRPARLAGIEPLRWGIRPGDGWRRKRRSPTTCLWPQTGGGALVGGRPPAPRRHGRGTARSGEDASWEAGAVVLERSGRPCDTARMAWDRGQSARGRGNSPGRPWRGGSPLFRPERARPCVGRCGCLNRQQGRGARPAPGRSHSRQGGARTEASEGALDRGSRDGPGGKGMARTGSAEHDTFLAFKALGGES
jgi:hypothetical protein